MKNRMLSLFLIMSLFLTCLGSLSTAVLADPTLPYVDETGAEQTVSATAKGTITDLAPRSVESFSVSVDKKVVGPGETVTITVEASGDVSGVSRAFMNYLSPSANWSRKIYLTSSDDNKLHFTYTVGGYDEIGEWRCEDIYWEDNAGNDMWVFNHVLDLSGGDFTVEGTNREWTPPTFESISVDNPTVGLGETVTVTVEASDDLSGVSCVWAIYDSPIENWGMSTSFQLDDDNTFRFTYTVGEYDETGEWLIETIILRDNAGNDTWVCDDELDLSGGDFTVTGTTPDLTPPSVKEISVDNQEVGPGETVTITVEADDDLSGGSYVFVYYRSPSGESNRSNRIDLSLGSDSKYHGTYTVGEYEETGVWQVDYIYLPYKARNWTYIYNSEIYEDGTLDLSGGDFEVKDTTPDLTPPTFESISVDNPIVGPGETVTVTVEASDDLSGVYLYADMECVSAGGEYFQFTDLELDDDNKFRIAYTVGEYEEMGVWQVYCISLKDNVGNSSYICNSEICEDASGYTTLDLSGGNFTVVDTTPDITPPSFESVSVDNEVVGLGESITVTVEASDDVSDVSRAYMYYLSPSKKWSQFIDLELGDDNNLLGTFTVGEHEEIGVWQVDYIYLLDSAGNWTNIYNSEVYEDDFWHATLDLSAGSFIVEDLTIDYTVEFQDWDGTVISTKTHHYGETVTIPTDPTREGYTFTGWDPALPDTMPAESIVVVAKWTINQYTITFDSNGGTAVADITQDYGTVITAPVDPTREGYIFDGWLPDLPDLMPAGGAGLTAQWTAEPISVSKLPTKIHYIKGESLDVSGGEIRVNNRFDLPMSAANVGAFDSNSTTYGPKTITVEYGGATTSFTVYLNRFSDVPYGYDFYPTIMDLAGKGIVAGYSDGRYGVNDNITRAQAAVMLVRALGLETEGLQSNFTDVPNNYWAAAQIAAAAKAKIVNGYGDGRFGPDAKITRAELSVMVARAFDIKVNPNKTVSFTDVPTGFWAEDYIKALASNGIVSGYRDGRFGVKDNATRAQFSKFLSYSLNLAE